MKNHPKTPREVLIKARALLSDPDRWCQGAEARNELGEWIDPTWNRAVKWCASGACKRVAPDGRLWMAAVQRLRRFTGDSTVGNYQDTHSHEQMLALFDQAIRAEPSRLVA